MANSHIPKDVLHGERVTGIRIVGQPYLRYKDCKRDVKMTEININNWETVISNCGNGDQLPKMA